jgi:MFS transporter, ACS family, hexuronate transporter
VSNAEGINPLGNPEAHAVETPATLTVSTLSPFRSVALTIVATLALSVSLLDRQSLSAVAPMLQSEMGISRQQFGFLGSAFALSYLVCAPIGGRLITAYGPRLVLALSVVLWSLVAAGHALASSFAWLVLGRLLLGITEAPSFPGSAETIRIALPRHRQSLGLGLLFTGSSIGAAVAAPLSVWSSTRFGLGAAFVVPALFGLTWLVPWLLVSRGLSAPSRDRVQSAPVLEILQHPAMHRQIVAVLCSAPCNTIVLVWFAQYLVDAAGVPKTETGHYLWLPPLVFDIGAVTFGLLRTRVKSAPLMLAAGTLVLCLGLSPLAPTPWFRVWAGALALAGGAGLYVIGTTDLIASVPRNMAATASGMSASVQSIVQIILGPIVGAYVDRTHQWGWVLASVGALGLPGALLWTRVGLSRPRLA